jgi:branched-chain amino acid transport system substrate-binding protein
MVRRRRFVQAWTLLAALGGLAACVADTGDAGYGRPAVVGAAPAVDSLGRRVTILLPLTGSTAEIGQAMLRAAQLSLDQPGAPPLDVRDTKGTPGGAAEAAKLAIAAGTGMLLGPLTAGETASVAPLAKAAGIPVLAFTSDASLAQPGVWALGITPAQQVRRLVLALQAEGRSRLAAVLPSNAFGDAMASGVTAAAGTAGFAAPSVLRYGNGFAALNTALKSVSDYDARRSAAEQQAAPAPDDADTRRRPKEAGRPLPPPPIDALLLGTAGEQLGQALPLLTYYGIGPEQVRILGPALWGRDASRLSTLSGAWYAAPDPAQRAPFEQAYAAKYNAPPRELASLAYDAAAVARVAADSGGFAPGPLTRPEGFTGADGLLGLQPDGQTRRGLAIFEIDHGGSHVVQPAPQSLQAPGV